MNTTKTKHLSIAMSVALALALAATPTHAAPDVPYQALLDAGNRQELAAAVQTSLAADKRDPVALLYAGRLALLDNRLEDAVEHLEAALDARPVYAEAQLWLGKALSQEALTASTFTRMRMVPRIRDAYEAAIRADGSNLDAREALLEYCLMAPKMFGGGVAKAKVQADAIRKIDGVRGEVALGQVAAAQDQVEAALGHFNAAIAQGRDDFRGYGGLSNFHYARKEWNLAFEALQPYLMAHPDDVVAQYRFGRIAAVSGERAAEGEAAIRAYLAQPPADATQAFISMVYVRLSQVLAHQGKADDAKQAIEVALRLDAQNPEAAKLAEG